jgi:hypothetical protein
MVNSVCEASWSRHLVIAGENLALATAQSLLPDASSPASADYVPDAQIGTVDSHLMSKDSSHS